MVFWFISSEVLAGAATTILRCATEEKTVLAGAIAGFIFGETTRQLARPQTHQVWYV